MGEWIKFFLWLSGAFTLGFMTCAILRSNGGDE